MEALKLIEECELYKYCEVSLIAFHQCEKITGGIQHQLTIRMVDSIISAQHQIELTFSEVENLRMEQDHVSNWGLQLEIVEKGDSSHEGGMRYLVVEEEGLISFTFKTVEYRIVQVENGGLC